MRQNVDVCVLLWGVPKRATGTRLHTHFDVINTSNPMKYMCIDVLNHAISISDAKRVICKRVRQKKAVKHD